MQAAFPKDEGIPILTVRGERSGLEREMTAVKTVKESQGMNTHCLARIYSSFTWYKNRTFVSI